MEKKFDQENKPVEAQTPKEDLIEKVARKHAEHKAAKAAKKAAKEAAPKKPFIEKVKEHKGVAIGTGLALAAVVTGAFAYNKGAKPDDVDPEWDQEPGENWPEYEDEPGEESSEETVNEE